MERKKEREYFFTDVNEYIVDHVFSWFCFLFGHMGVVRSIYSSILHSWTKFNALYTHKTSFDNACTKLPGPCQKHISIKAQTSPTVYLFKMMYRIRILGKGCGVTLNQFPSPKVNAIADRFEIHIDWLHLTFILMPVFYIKSFYCKF